jgi:hypothetical protein
MILNPLIVEGEEVGEYNDTTFSFDKYQMANCRVVDISQRILMLISMTGKYSKSFYKEKNDDYKYVDCEDEEFHTRNEWY